MAEQHLTLSFHYIAEALKILLESIAEARSEMDALMDSPTVPMSSHCGI